VFELRGPRFGRVLLYVVAFVTAFGLVMSSSLAQTEAPAKSIFEPLTPPENVTAKAVYVQDATAGTPLFSLNPDERRSPASTTKLMTALVVANNTTDWQELVTAEEVDVRDISDNESMIGLLAGDVFTIEQPGATHWRQVAGRRGRHRRPSRAIHSGDERNGGQPGIAEYPLRQS
jgi:D-alanyl-D-alanine carboxypeptidase